MKPEYSQEKRIPDVAVVTQEKAGPQALYDNRWDNHTGWSWLLDYGERGNDGVM